MIKTEEVLLEKAAETIQRLGAAAQDCKSCANLTLCNAYKDGDRFKNCEYKWIHTDDICTEFYYNNMAFAPKLICKACLHEVPCITGDEGKVTQFDFCPYCGRKIKVFGRHDYYGDAPF